MAPQLLQGPLDNRDDYSPHMRIARKFMASPTMAHPSVFLMAKEFT